MKLWKAISTIFVFTAFFTFDADETYAQFAKTSPQIKILNNYGSIPFEDGKTVIAEVKFIGLDTDYEDYDEAIGKRIPESDLERVIELVKPSNLEPTLGNVAKPECFIDEMKYAHLSV